MWSTTHLLRAVALATSRASPPTTRKPKSSESSSLRNEAGLSDARDEGTADGGPLGACHLRDGLSGAGGGAGGASLRHVAARAAGVPWQHHRGDPRLGHPRASPLQPAAPDQWGE